MTQGGRRIGRPLLAALGLDVAVVTLTFVFRSPICIDGAGWGWCGKELGFPLSPHGDGASNWLLGVAYNYPLYAAAALLVAWLARRLERRRTSER